MFVVIANSDSKRVELFQNALRKLGQPPAQIIAYSDLLAGKADLARLIPSDAIVRIESPDKDFKVEQAILALGAVIPDEAGDYARLSRAEVAKLSFDNGAILYPRQWYLGYRALLEQIKTQLAACPSYTLMNHPDEIAVMFDKPACHALLAANGIAVPRSPGVIHSYNQLLEWMQQSRCYRVFVKLAHGSSASGVVAYQISGDKQQATTTVEMVQMGGSLRLYNSRRLHTYTKPSEIATLIEALCRHRVQVEQWIPKAGFQNRTFDLRVVVIGGTAQHVVVRLSKSAFTNLHLANGRTFLDSLLTRLDPAVWEAARETCEKVMGLFPHSLYSGIDLLIASDYKRHAVAEVNAFGDLLYHTLYHNKDTYTAEIEAILG